MPTIDLSKWKAKYFESENFEKYQTIARLINTKQWFISKTEISGSKVIHYAKFNCILNTNADNYRWKNNLQNIQYRILTPQNRWLQRVKLHYKINQYGCCKQSWLRNATISLKLKNTNCNWWIPYFPGNVRLPEEWGQQNTFK